MAAKDVLKFDRLRVLPGGRSNAPAEVERVHDDIAGVECPDLRQPENDGEPPMQVEQPLGIRRWQVPHKRPERRKADAGLSIPAFDILHAVDAYDPPRMMFARRSRSRCGAFGDLPQPLPRPASTMRLGMDCLDLPSDDDGRIVEV